MKTISRLVHLRQKVDRSCWCTVIDEESPYEKRITARIEHVGGGKFIIREAEDALYNGRIVDASNVVSCRV